MALTWGLVVFIQGTAVFDTGYRFEDFETCLKAKASARYEAFNREHIPQLEKEAIEQALLCIPMKKGFLDS